MEEDQDKFENNFKATNIKDVNFPQICKVILFFKNH